jgi:hypothetical protein
MSDEPYLSPEQKAALVRHHTPNILPPGHTRKDFDFKYQDGVMGPIRLARQKNDSIFLDIPAKVWCIRHTHWENEVL